jgi:hypothetical protein
MKMKIPTSLPAKVVYFLAAVFVVVVYVLWRMHRDDLTMVVLDIGLMSALIATIMYPLFCSQ